MAGRGGVRTTTGYSPNQNVRVWIVRAGEMAPMTDFETYPNAMKPLWFNDGYSQGISSAAFLQGEQWGDWDGRAVVSFLGIGFGGTPVGRAST